MSTMIFVDVLAYSAVGLLAIAMIVLGITLMRPSTAPLGLAAFLGDARAEKVIARGVFDHRRARAVGGLILFFAVFLIIAIVRGIVAH